MKTIEYGRPVAKNREKKRFLLFSQLHPGGAIMKPVRFNLDQ